MILHIDMDAFFASIELRENPALAGLPVVVGGSADKRGVVAAASYAARQYGIFSAMPMAKAIKLCPQLRILPVRMSLYARDSAHIREIFHRYTPQVEPLSLDEAFLDVAASERLFGPAEQIGRRIKQEIYDETGLIASVGVAPNKFLAKVASDLDKPDGFVCVAPGQETAFLDPLPIERLWGAGPVSQAALKDVGLAYIGDVRRCKPDELEALFGSQGRHFWNLAHGRDERDVVPYSQAKSISNETTFAQDIRDAERLQAWLMTLTEEVAQRLRHDGRLARTVQLKLRYRDFSTVTRRNTMAQATRRTDRIWQQAQHLLHSALCERNEPVRLIGIGVSGFQEHADTQADLFADPHIGRDSEVDQISDAISDRFGDALISRARTCIVRTKD